MASTFIKEVRAGNVRDDLIKDVQALVEKLGEIERQLMSDSQTTQEWYSCNAIKGHCHQLVLEMDRTRRSKS